MVKKPLNKLKTLNEEEKIMKNYLKWAEDDKENKF